LNIVIDVEKEKRQSLPGGDVVGIASCASSTKWKVLGILDSRKILDGFIGVLLPWNYTLDSHEESSDSKSSDREIITVLNRVKLTFC
jgi:hypothetical protein